MYNPPAIPHIASVFQRPRQGASLVAQYLCYDYKHSLTAMGGYDSVSFAIKASPAEARYVLEALIGCVVQIHVDDPVTPIFEGYISSITHRPGAVVRTLTLDDMANRANVTYYSADKAAGIKTEQTAVINTTESQDIYGVKETSVDAGIHFNDADKTHKNLLRNTYKSERAWPLLTTTLGSGNGELEIEVRGLWEMAWNWQNYLNATNNTQDAGTLIKRVVNRTDFFAPTNSANIYLTGGAGNLGLTYLDANTAFNMSQNSESGQTYWQYLQSICEAGEGVRPWIIGITPPDQNLGSRFAYYRAANATVEYMVDSVRDGRIRDLYGNLVPPYLVKPDRGVVFSDMLPGLYTDGNDPSYAYIDTVTYEANTGAVSWASPSDRTMNGVFNRRRYYKGQGRGPFGAVVRQVL